MATAMAVDSEVFDGAGGDVAKAANLARAVHAGQTDESGDS